MPRGNYSRANAQKQRRTFVAPKPEPVERDYTWWAQPNVPREGFTKHAMDKLHLNVPTVYRFPGAE